MCGAAVYSVSVGERGQDRALVVELPEGTALILSDGAGGVVGGEQAADLVIQQTRAWLAVLGRLPDAEEWARWLVRLDERLLAEPLAGDATAVCVSLAGSEIAGASVGDSEAWLVCGSDSIVLTRHQHRKPLLGGGEAVPVPFSSSCAVAGCLIIGSDGLFRFVKEEAILRAAADRDVERAARDCAHEGQ